MSLKIVITNKEGRYLNFVCFEKVDSCWLSDESEIGIRGDKKLVYLKKKTDIKEDEDKFCSILEEIFNCVAVGNKYIRLAEGEDVDSFSLNYVK